MQGEGEDVACPSPSLAQDVDEQVAGSRQEEAAALLARLDLQCSPVAMWPKVLIIPAEDAGKWRWVELHIQSVVNYITVFKVKTTTRKEFMVQPAKGLIAPLSTLIVRIGLQPGAAATKGKFQVVAAPIVSGPAPSSVDAFWALLGSTPNFSKKVIKWIIASPPPLFIPTPPSQAAPPAPSSSANLSLSSSAILSLPSFAPSPSSSSSSFSHAVHALSMSATPSFILSPPSPSSASSPSFSSSLPLALSEFFSVLGISSAYLLKICSDEGIDDASFFEEYSLEDLVKIGVKNAHARRIKSSLARLIVRRESADNKNEEAPPAYD